MQIIFADYFVFANLKKIMIMRLLLFLSTLLLISCSKQTKQTVKNEEGRYSIDVLSGWVYRVDGVETRIIMPENKDTGNGQISISIYESEYSTLDESFNRYTENFGDGFEDFQFVGKGDTQISGIPTKWHRIRETNKGVRHETVQYIMQPKGKFIIDIVCSATVDSYEEYEEAFITMVFSLKLFNK